MGQPAGQHQPPHRDEHAREEPGEEEEIVDLHTHVRPHRYHHGRGKEKKWLRKRASSSTPGPSRAHASKSPSEEGMTSCCLTKCLYPDVPGVVGVAVAGGVRCTERRIEA